MSSYLAAYGKGEERQAKLFKIAVIVIPAVLVLSVAGYFFFRHYPQRAQLQGFIDDLAAGRHKAAYARFGCTDATPCRDYKWESFERDFGPQGEFRDLPSLKIAEKWSCEGGIIRGFDAGPKRDLVFFIPTEETRLSFAPPRQSWRGCTMLP